MLVEVEGGKLQTVSGDKDNPDSQGFLCVRGRSTNEIFGNPRRLLYPKFVMIAAQILGAARVGMRHWI
jgi:anaerobic selenocysteine-containing dehydrogenase